MNEYTTVLTIAGSDSGGGAGIQADLKTMTALGCFGTSAITSLTAQNTQGVQGIFPVSPDFIRQQLQSLSSDFNIKGVKIGMLNNDAVIEEVASFLKTLEDVPVVLDPVMVATSKDVLLEPQAITALREKLIPLATVITPNVHEAEALSDIPIEGIEQMEAAARSLREMRGKNILIKGGDLDATEAIDLLYTEDGEFVTFKSDMIETQNTHGTGCSYSSAIASYLAKGEELRKAISLSKNFITSAIVSGARFKIGKGNGPINHMWKIQNNGTTN